MRAGLPHVNGLRRAGRRTARVDGRWPDKAWCLCSAQLRVGTIWPFRLSAATSRPRAENNLPLGVVLCVLSMVGSCL